MYCAGTDGQAHNTPFAEMVFSDQIPKCRSCEGLVKPDIVFFGESLPARFFGCVAVGTDSSPHDTRIHAHDTPSNVIRTERGRSAPDFQECDLLIVMGTSLQVQPFASLVQKVPQSCPRLLINREVPSFPPHAHTRAHTRTCVVHHDHSTSAQPLSPPVGG